MLKKLKNERRVGRDKDLGKKIPLGCAQIVVMALKIPSQYPLRATAMFSCDGIQGELVLEMKQRERTGEYQTAAHYKYHACFCCDPPYFTL